MTYAWRLWAGFALVLMVLLTAMGMITATTLRLERAEAEAHRRAAVDEAMRLALWRMDSALAPLLAQENARPYYRQVAPQQGLTGAVPGSDFAIRTQSLDASGESRFVLLRFQYAADELRDAFALAPDVDDPASTQQQAPQQLIRRVPLARLLAKLPAAQRSAFSVWQLADEAAGGPDAKGTADDALQARAAVEYQQRSQSFVMNNAFVQQLQAPESISKDAAPVMMTPLWVPDELLLARQIDHDGAVYVQGCLLDWPAMQQWLLTLVDDLLPHARLQPLERFDAAGEAGLLAALPVRLLPGPLTPDPTSVRAAVTQTLVVAWLAVGLASVVGAVLTVGVMRLSQRRAAFVAAVTHELRTPLTTFRMYSEMLAQGMIRDQQVQRQYLQTLHDQSQRLSHLVENVLAYARLERGRGPRPPAELPLSQLLEGVLPHLQQLADAQQMQLVVEPSTALDVPVRASRSAAEQILINLVDNACKYANGAADRRIELSASVQGRCVALRVRDHGPGLPRRGKWFQLFSKTVQQAAHSAPGVGLGLGLSRRLAEQMGGRLDIDGRSTEGAALVLRLPLADGISAAT